MEAGHWWTRPGANAFLRERTSRKGVTRSSTYGEKRRSRRFHYANIPAANKKGNECFRKKKRKDQHGWQHWEGITREETGEKIEGGFHRIERGKMEGDRKR